MKKKYIQIGVMAVLVMGVFAFVGYIGRALNGSAEGPYIGVDVGTVTDAFMERYFASYYELRNNPENDMDNLLLVIAEERPNDYGAVSVIEAPYQTYLLYYDSAESREVAFAELERDDIISVERNEIRYYVNSYMSWGIEEMGLNEATVAINSMSSPNSVKVAIIDSGLMTNVFRSYFPDRTMSLHCVTSCTENEDLVGHGTHVAGTVAEGTPDNVSILSIKADTAMVVDGRVVGGFYDADLVEAVNYAISNSADVINMSLGGSDIDNTVANVLNAAMNQGIVTVAAAGNEATQGNPVEYPAALDSTMSVGALDSNLQHAYFSTYNNYVDFAAPGVDIMSLDAETGGLVMHDGTSMATPHMSAAVAIVKSFNKNLNLSQTIDVLKTRAIDLGAAGKDPYYGWGFVDYNGASFCSSRKHCDSYNVFVRSDLVENMTDGAASYTTDGETVYVTSNKACVMLETTDGGTSYNRLNATATDSQNRYSFKLSSAENVKAYIVLAGDVDLGGSVESYDAAEVADYVANGGGGSGIQMMIADVNKNGIINSTDALLIAKDYSGVQAIGW